MYLKKDKIVAEIGNDDGTGSTAHIIMRSFMTGLGNEYILDPTAVQGWDDGVIVRRNATERLGRDGDFKESASFGSRVISFSGTAVAKSSRDLRVMRDDLMSLFTAYDYQTLSVDVNGSKRYAEVGLEGTTSWVQQADTFALFRITFYAPDPFIYGELRRMQTGITKANPGGLVYLLAYPLAYTDNPTDSVTIYNNGNAPAWPKFDVIGNFDNGFSINDGRGNIVRYSGMVRKASRVTIDMAKGSATQSGQDRTGQITQRDWFSIPPKSSLSPVFVPNADSSGSVGDGWCDIIVRDTWI
jgi:hypothetical protein